MKQYIAARLMSNFLIELRFADSCASFERWPFAPVSATSKEAEWVSSPRSAPPEARGNQGNQGSVAVNAARKVMSISEDLHIQEDYSEDNELEEAIERIRASEPYTRRAARCGRTAPQVSAPRMATSEFDSASARDGGLGGAKQAPQPASSTSSFDDIQARTAALSSRIRPRSAEQRSYAAGSQSSRPSSARSARSRANWSVQSTPARSVVGNIRCDQLISRHLPEREELFAKEIPVAFAIDWRQSSDGNLSDAIQDKGLSVLRSLVAECEAHGVPPAARCAIATEVFRQAGNGAAYLEKVLKEVSLPVQVLSQQQEAEIGYSTAVALADVPDSVICWDSGGASFQITMKDGDGLQAYMGGLGTGVVTSILVQDVQGQSLSSKPTPNPVSSSEAEKLVTQLKSRLDEGPKWLKSSKVTAIGGPNSMFCIAFEALGKTHFNSTEIRTVLNSLIGQSDEQLSTQAFCQGPTAKWLRVEHVSHILTGEYWQNLLSIVSFYIFLRNGVHASWLLLQLLAFGELREAPGYILPKIALLLSVMEHCEIAEARSRMISVLARQLERLRDHIPAFAQQWQTVEAFISLCQQRVADKAKEGFLSVPRRQQLLVAAALLAPQAAMAREGFTETSSGLQYKVVQEGTGPIPTTGQRIKADYTGWLDDFESDRKFDSSRDRRQPLEFQVGIGKVIKGWDESLLSMKVGERRQIIVPPVLGYGNRGIGPIPPGSTLYFDVELKSIEQQEQPWKPVVLVLVFWALSAANVYFCWCYPGSSLLASASHISSLLMCVLLSFILAVPTIPKSRKPFMQAIWYTILGGMLPAAVSVSLLQWRHGELPEPMLDYFETPSSYSLRGADTVGTWGLQPLAQAGIVSWAPVAYLQSTILWIVTLYNLTHVVGSVDASVQQDLPLSLQVIYYVIVALWLSSLIRVLCTRPGQPKDFQGFGNYKYFVMFITYSAVALLFKAVTLLLFSIKAFQNEITFCTKLWLVCTEILVIALGGTMVAFSGFHLFLSSKGMTTIEFLTRHEKSEKKISFDQGVLGNLQASLGRIPLFWLLPACPPSGDGRNFPYTVIPQELEPNKDQSAESRSLALAAPQTKSSLKENLNQRNSKLSDIRAPSQPCLQSTAEPTCLEQQQDGCVAADGFGEDRVEALEEEIRVLQKLHARQYDLLDQGLQRQVEEAKSAWKARRRHVEACKQEEYELHSKVVSQEQRTKALKTTLEKTWRQMEDMQQSVSRSRAVLEARANGDWSADLDESTMCGKSRQMAEEMQRHMEVRQELNSQRNQVQAATEVLGQQRVDLACSESAQIALGAFCCDSLDRCNMLQLVFI
eukprot:s701_g7.t2